MSKLSFRARALDASKPMPIYLAEELPDLPDYSAINRAVPQMPSGMEKEEESEHHLQRAISGSGLIIPTPEVCSVSDLAFYERCYPPHYRVPKQHIHMQPLWEEQEMPEYDMDSEDERWLRQQRHPDLTELLFEQMMDKLEKSSGQTVATLAEAKLLLQRADDLVIAVYDYWLNKRLTTQHPLILSVKTESRVGQSTNNPYLAFRRRTEKMQTRKNRKNDESSYEKMLKLRRELARALTLLQLVARREAAKRDLVRLTGALAERRYRAGELDAPEPALEHRPVYASVSSSFRRSPLAAQQLLPRAPPADCRQREKRPYKRRKHRHHTLAAAIPPRETGVSSSEEETSGRGDAASSSPDPGPFAFRRKPGCYYELPTSTLCGDPLEPERAAAGAVFEHELDERHRYTLTSLSAPYPRCIGLARRRVGRGGRVLLDRLASPLDELWPRLAFLPPGASPEEMELETKAHRHPKEMWRDYHTSGKYPWRHAFRRHLAQNPHLWLDDVKPDADVKLHAEDVKMEVDDVKIEVDDVKMDITKTYSDLPQDSDISVRTDGGKCSDSDSEMGRLGSADPGRLGSTDPGRPSPGCVDPGRLDEAVRDNLDQVLRKRSYSGCSDDSYDSDESLYPVEKEFEKFISEVNRDWLHFRPVSPPPPAPAPSPPPLPADEPFSVQLLHDDVFTTTPVTLAALCPDEGASLRHDYLGVEEDLDVDQLAHLHAPDLMPTDNVFSCSPPLGSSSVRVQDEPAARVPRLRGGTPPPPPPPAPAPAPVVVQPSPKKVQAAPKEDKDRERERERDRQRAERERDRERLERDSRPEPSPVPPSNIIVEEVNDLPPAPQIKVEKKKASDTIEEIVLAHGVQLKTVQTKHSPLKKHIITSAPRRAGGGAGGAAGDRDAQIVTVAVSDSLKVRLQNHLVSSGAGAHAVTTGAGTVVGLVQNGPFASGLVVQQARDAVSSVACLPPALGRRVPAPLVHISGAAQQIHPLQAHGGVSGAPVLLAHHAHHAPHNKLKVLTAHPLTHEQRRELLAGGRSVASVGSVLSLAQRERPPMEGAPLGKGPHLVNVVRGAAPGAKTVTRLDLCDKRRQLVFDGTTLKGNLSAVSRPHRVNVSLEGRALLRAPPPPPAVPLPALPLAGGAAAGPRLRHQIQLKGRTLVPARGAAVAGVVAGAAGGVGSGPLPPAVVANLLHKNVKIPPGGQKISLPHGVGVTVSSAGVAALALSAGQLRALHHRHTELVESAASTSTAAAPGDDDQRPRNNDSLPMEVT